MSKHSLVGSTLHLEGQSGNTSYALERRIGGGGYSTVFLGRTVGPTSPSYVALKVLKESGENNSVPLNFMTELEIAQRCAGDHVVTPLDAGEACIIEPQGERLDRKVVAFEYVPGLTLRQQLKYRGRPAVSEVLEIADQMAAGLTTIHQNGFVHRDISPHNVIYNPALKRAVIADLGAAQALSEPSDKAYGTVGYIAPEQFQEQKIKSSADVFSLGAVLFELLQGHKAFPGESAKECFAQCTKTPHHLPELNIEGVLLREALLNELLLATSPQAKNRPTPTEVATRLRTTVEEVGSTPEEKARSFGTSARIARAFIAKTVRLPTERLRIT